MAVTIDLSGRTAWVTGGASGIGRAVARQLAAAGAHVVSIDLSAGDAELGIDGCVLDLRDGNAIEHSADNLEGTRMFRPAVHASRSGFRSPRVVRMLMRQKM